MHNDSEGNPFGDWLLNEIETRDWTIAEFARRANVPRQTAQKWVRNERRPDPPSCYRIADALTVDADVVLDLAGHRPDINIDMAAIDPEMRVYFAGFPELPPHLQRILRMQARAVYEAYRQMREDDGSAS